MSKGVGAAGKVNQDLVDFTDFLPTLAPEGITLDGRSFAPQLLGQQGNPREWLFCHYDPRWLDFEFARYAQDKRYKLYDNRALYDYRRDSLEMSPLAQASLTSAQERSRQKLQRVGHFEITTAFGPTTISQR